MIYGYTRVSTDGQSVDAQVKQLREAVPLCIITDDLSGDIIGISDDSPPNDFK